MTLAQEMGSAVADVIGRFAAAKIKPCALEQGLRRHDLFSLGDGESCQPFYADDSDRSADCQD